MGTVGVKALFIPLKARFYWDFVAGLKDTEYRPYGPRWNEGTCKIGRPVLLSKGYGKRERSWGQIVGFERKEMCSQEWLSCYGAPGDAACIKIKLHATAQGDIHE
jgi:hypothetical protein